MDDLFEPTVARAHDLERSIAREIRCSREPASDFYEPAFAQRLTGADLHRHNPAAAAAAAAPFPAAAGPRHCLLQAPPPAAATLWPPAAPPPSAAPWGPRWNGAPTAADAAVHQARCDGGCGALAKPGAGALPEQKARPGPGIIQPSLQPGDAGGGAGEDARAWGFRTDGDSDASPRAQPCAARQWFGDAGLALAAAAAGRFRPDAPPCGTLTPSMRLALS